MATTKRGIYHPNDYNKVADVISDMKKMAESIDEAIENSEYNDKDIKNSIKDIQDEQKVQNENIETNTTKNTQQDKLIQKLKANMIQESTEQNTGIHVEDASDLASVLNIEGNHYQEISESSPAEIFTVKDNIKLIQCNKNIFKLPDSTLVGVELTNQDDGSYKLNGASTASWAYREGEAIWLFPGKYTISIETSENVAACFGIRTEDNSLKVELTTTRKEYTFEITKATKVKPYFTCSSSAVFNNNIVKVQLEKSSSKTNWIKHEKNEYNLAVQQEMLKSDKFDLINNKEVHNWGYINTKNVANMEVALNGSNENFRRYSVNLKINNRKSGEYLKILCTHFKNIDSRWHEREGICGWESGQTFCIGTFNTELDTAEKMKTFLQNNDVKIYYELAASTELELTEEQKATLQQLNNLELFKGVNNIYAEQNLALLQLDYIADTKMYIDNKINGSGE